MVLAFDPGVSVGFAAINYSGDILETRVHKAEAVTAGYFIRACKVKYPGAEIVIEQGPLLAGNYRFLTQQVEETLRRSFPNALWVPPGQWKKHRSARKLSGMSQHEKDAVNIALWFLSRRQVAR